MFGYGKSPAPVRDHWSKITGKMMGRRFQPGAKPDATGFFQVPPLPVPGADQRGIDPAAYFQMSAPTGGR